MYELAGKRIWVAGHTGMVGSAVCRRLKTEDCEILTVPRAELDLLRQSDVEAWCAQEKPDAVIVCAARVGGILANDTYPADFIYQNLTLETNIIHSAYKTGVEKLIFLGSSCIYPKHAPQPIPEDAILTGALESTNEWYAVAKIAGIKLCQAYRKQHGCDFISAMPTNLYGPGDNFDLETSHVVPALLRKCHEAHINGQEHMEVWGTGAVRREFLHVDDCADGIIFLLRNYSDHDHVNLGSDDEISIADLAQLICDTVGFSGELQFDTSRPIGTPRKKLNTEKMTNMGWRAQTKLNVGLDLALQDMIARYFK
ncbi:MAG: GDP-L-fucose synthase [Rhodobiaceae bacterium UBA7378]|nr:MAG: GDP-L-fucose synthase [Rhodobiaceae bacterium UBA7378]